jgi:hypothetical protein
MTRPAAERVQLGQTPWHCDPQGIICEHDHLFAFYKAGYRADFRRLSGHAFFQCRECDPPTYFAAVWGKLDGIATVTCYAIDRASYEEWDKGDEPSPQTPELLYRLRDPSGRSHNPSWRPPR